MKKNRLASFFGGILLFGSGSVYATGSEQNCILNEIQNGDDSRTIAQIKALCRQEVADESSIEVEGISPDNTDSAGAISHRLSRERQNAFNPYVITPHKMNYILPAYKTNAINTLPYFEQTELQDNLDDLEAKFQISLKVPLFEDSLFIEGDALYLGFTLQAWWQIYASNISKPFRETNYQPELFYLAPLGWQPFGGNTAMILGIEHQSNGRGRVLSRSWNRVYTSFLFEKEGFALSFRPWVRLNEEDKQFPFDPSGDDNPDIEDFLGHFELGMAYEWDDIEFVFQGRRNFATDNGSAELGITFPLFGRLRGYATFFTGYGESLIDYNYRQTRYGLGVALTDIL